MPFFRRLVTACLILVLIPFSASGKEPRTALDTAGTGAPGNTVALGVEGINRHTGDDDPGVLYILPWQPPTLPRRSRAELDAGSEDLLEPMDPLTLERHRIFRKTLDPSLDSTLFLQ